MKYSLNAKESKEIDEFTINRMGVPEAVLTEKAALGVCHAVCATMPVTDKVLCVCGTGNNGGDAIAAARILFGKGYNVSVYQVGDKTKISKETKKQLKIAKNYGIKVIKKADYQKYDVIIDGIFGTGLSRNITGDLYKEIEAINNSHKKVVSVDIPSGVSADNGRILGIAIRAEITVTFGFIKNGCILYPGAEYSGKVIIWDIGTSIAALSVPPSNFFYDENPKLFLPKRKPNSNKGTYGRALVVAGSKNMSGAAYFAASAAYRMGAGLVRILTCEENREIIQRQIPEAVLTTYGVTDDGNLTEDSIETVKEAVESASVVLVGPGIGKTKAAALILNYIISECKVPLIIDADGLNILSKLVTEKVGENASPESRIKVLKEILPAQTILTPHKMELSRLTGIPISTLSIGLIDESRECTRDNDLIFVKKDARSIVSFGNSNYINISGNDGMATAGSGDVLAGIILGLLAQGDTPKAAAMTGCYIHGICGNVAAEKKGARSMLASDILDAIPGVISENKQAN